MMDKDTLNLEKLAGIIQSNNQEEDNFLVEDEEETALEIKQRYAKAEKERRQLQQLEERRIATRREVELKMAIKSDERRLRDLSDQDQ